MDLSYARFLNLAQYAMMLTVPAEKQAEVQRVLSRKYAPVPVEEGAPDWWLGDEEASASSAAAIAMLGGH